MNPRRRIRPTDRRPPFYFVVCGFCSTPVLEGVTVDGYRFPVDYCWECESIAHLVFDSDELPERQRAEIVRRHFIVGLAS
jgi:hypothetical protein